MIYVSENKAQIVKGDFRPAEFYKGSTRIAGYSKESFEGEEKITLKNCYNDRLYNVTFSSQEGEHKISVKARGKNILKNPLDLTSWERGMVDGYNGYAYIFEDILPPGEVVTLSFDYKTLPSYFYFVTDDEEIPLSTKNQETGIGIVYLTTSTLVNGSISFLAKKDRVYGLLSARSSNYLTEEAAQGWLDKFKYIQLETGEKATTFEEYKEPQFFEFCSDTDSAGESPVVIPTFRGTTVYEINTEVPATISGEYKKQEV